MSDFAEPRDERPSNADLDVLIERYLVGNLTEDDARRLLERIETDSNLGQSILDQFLVDTMLRGLCGARTTIGTPIPPEARGHGGASGRVSPRRGLFDRSTIAVAAASVALIVGAIVWSKKPLRESAPSDRGRESSQAVLFIEPTTASVAVLARSVDVSWSDPSRSYEVGSPLNPGWLRLQSGLAEIEFYSGARVVLEGPGELELRSSIEAYCSSGRLSAEIPPSARGFRIGTPSGAVVDLGTEFGLDVTGAGSEVHVFKGEVELHADFRPKRSLKEGEAAAIDKASSVRMFAANPTAFATPAVMRSKSAESLRRRYDAWRTASARWNSDPSLLVRLDFEGLAPGDQTLPNRANSGSTIGPATIVGCGRVEGRWPGKGALEFRGVGDRVRLDVPGEISSLTFAAWVRVNGLDRRFNSLFMSDDFKAGATHWQILNNGRIRLGVAGRSGAGHVDYDSPVVFTPERLGRWVHLAVVFDADRRQVIHYVDGRPVSSNPVRNVFALRVGPAEIGNWSSATRVDRSPIRHYSGRIDEFSFYRRALDEAEIGEISGLASGADDS